MNASFIIGFHTARLKNLVQTMSFLMNWHTEVVKNCEVILVCQDEFREAHVYAQDWKKAWANLQTFSMDLPCMHLPHVTNFGVSVSRCEKLIILESDRILPRGYFASIIDQLETGVQITAKAMKRPKRDLTDEEIDGDFEFEWELRSKDAKPGERNMWSGNTALMKNDFEKVGGMDEFYKGYGWADCDMTLTMENAGVQSIYREEEEIHLWHEPATYGRGDQKQMFIENGIYFCQKWKLSFPIFLREEIAKQKRDLI